MEKLFLRLAQERERWSEHLPDAPVTFEVTVDGHTLVLDDWLGDLRRDADGRRGRLLLSTGDLVKGTGKNAEYRGDKLLQAWVEHLAGHVAGEPLTTKLLSKKGEPTFEPMPPETARHLLADLMAAWHAGQRRPLPLAIETALTWLRKPDDAREIYEGHPGASNAAGRPAPERDRDAALARAFPDFDALVEGGEFERLAERLLRPLRDAPGTPPNDPKKDAT